MDGKESAGVAAPELLLFRSRGLQRLTTQRGSSMYASVGAALTGEGGQGEEDQADVLLE